MSCEDSALCEFPYIRDQITLAHVCRQETHCGKYQVAAALYILRANYVLHTIVMEIKYEKREYAKILQCLVIEIVL